MADSKRSQIARIGGLTTASRYSGTDMTAAARRGQFQRFLDQVDPEGRLQPEERERRAIAARRAHMARIALESVKARQRRRQERGLTP